MKKGTLLFLSIALIIFLAEKAIGQDLDPVAPKLQTVPAGSYVIAMDDTLQKDPTYNVFNIRSYGLLATILDNRIELLWAIRAGKVKDDTDFSAIATRVFPTTQAATVRRFRAGPFIVSIVDTTGLSAIIKTFNTANPGHAINVYQLTSATTVDIRYTLNQIPKAAVLNDGGNAPIQLNYMTLAAMPSANYRELSSAVNLSDSCFTFASEPHNGHPVAAVMDSLSAFVVNDGGNFLAQCAAVTNYENSTSGRFQTTLGISANPIPNAGYTLYYPHADLPYTQYEGNFDGYAIGGICNTWELSAGSVLTNNASKYDQYGLNADSVIICQSVSKNGTGSGHLVFYAGGHDYGTATDANHVNGMRSYFNAMFTPSNVSACAFLIFDNDLGVTKTASPTMLLLNKQDTFTMVITNFGPSSLAATNVTAVDTIPAGFTFVSSYASKGSYNSGTHAWSVGTMSNGESDTLIIVATAVSVGSITNTIFINKEKYDFNQSNDTARATVTVRACPTIAPGRDTAVCSGKSVVLSGSLSVSGGTPPYAYNWSPSNGLSATNIANPTATPVSSANYILNVTDSMGCLVADTFAISLNPLPSITASSNSFYCFGSTIMLGSIPSGGTSPYSYSWFGPSGFSSTQQNPELLNATTAMAGTYSVTVTDTNLCTAINTAVISLISTPISVTKTTTGVSCFGGANGAITLSIGGGTSPYSFNWGGGITTQNRSNLIAGTYNVTITDANLCSTTRFVTIVQPAALSTTAIPTAVSCFGGNNGAITLNVSGGTSPNSFNWSGGITTQSRTNLTAGIYNVTVTDANLCSTTGTATITQPAAALNAIATPTAVSCFGGNNGAISLSVTGGTSPYSYNWGGGVTTQNRTNLSAGTYDVTVTDANLCSITGTATITQTAAALSVIATPAAVSCFGGNNGAITLSVSGGTSPYTYNWGGGITTQNRTNLAAGTYNVTVTDANLCSITGTATITQPAAALSATATPTAVKCFGGNNGAINLSVSGGTLTYSFNWGGGITTQNRTNLVAGIYNVTVTDANLCTITGTATITQPVSALSVTATPTAVSCFGGSNGAISLSVSGGTLAYSFNWGGGITMQNRTNLAAAAYNVTVTDANLCTATGTATITQPAAALSAVATPTPVKCFGGNSGAITLNVSGGTSAYSFNWGGGITTQNRTNLTAGAYNVTVTDANLCTTTGTATITQPAAALSITATPTAVSCFGGNNGAISLSVSGGTLAYSFNWGGGVTTQNRTNLVAGIYNVTMTDANLCSITGTATITQPVATLSVTATPTAVSCFGGNNGAITLSVSGGTSPYSYSWGGGDTTQNRANLSAGGTYYVTVTDANLCSTTGTATITQPAAALNAIATPTAVSCFSGSNGAISLSVTGGTSPYTYNWGGGITTQNRTNLSAGTYDVTVTDAKLCSTTGTATITQPAVALNAVATPTAVSCFSGNNGAITLGVTGGTSPYTYNWGGGITTQNRTNLTAGTYDVTVTDANLCSTTATATITQPAAALNAIATPTAVSCFSGSNGGITLSVSGGTAAYSYNWGGGITTQNRTNLSAGTYDVTITDANLCSTTGTATITQPAAALSATATPTAVSCFGGNNGAISLSVTGGTSPYTYNWGGGIATQNRTNLSAGTYDVTVTDAKLCSITGTATITQPAAALSATATPTAVSCFGGNNGAISLSVSGGTSPYTYNWGGGITTQNRTNLSAGTYNVTVTDANLCSTTGTATITQPAAALNAIATPTAVSCFSGSNGAISLGVTGGTSPYTYNWGGGITTQNRTNLSAGTYDVTVTDVNLCSITGTATITQPTAALSATATPTAVNCFGGNNGAISLSVTGGTSPYSYNWGGGITTQNRTNLAAGTYNVTVTDANLCSTTGTATITQPAAALNAIATPTAVSCFSGSNGAITLSVSGGTAAYSYNWGGGITTQNRTNLSAGTYDVTVTDAKLCSITGTATITQPAAALSATATPTAVSCFGGNNGAISLSVTGGTSPYSYNWGGGITTQNRTNLTAGTYDVTVTDANLCSTTATATITQPAAALNAIATPTAVSCFSGSNGGITLSVSGGTAAYSYNWGGGITTQNRTNLSAGTYDVTITDANLCSTTGTATITQPAAALSATATPTAVSCFGGNNGAISLSVTGGTSPYTYNWGGGIATQNRTNLSAGTYDVTVTDAKLCSITGTATITQPAAALSATATPTAVSCFGGNNGAISLSVSGGTSPYSFNWGGGITTQNRTNLTAGTYNVTVTDAKLCSITGTATITQPAAALSVTATPTAVSCFSGSNGGITLNVNGGTSPYAFNWNGGITTQNRTNLSAGTYDVTVTDAKLCSITGTATITQPAAALSATATPTAVSCFGGSNGAITLSVSGGTSSYTYNWGGGITTQNRTNLSAGTYDVTVTDANLCSITAAATITQPAGALSVTTTPTAVSCFGGSNGAITLSVSGGTSSYTYNWGGGITTQNRTNLSAGTYDVTVTDANLCSTTGTATITQPAAALGITATPTAVSCFGGSNGGITLGVSGGTSPYSFNWGGGITTQNRTNLSAGTYDVTVTDVNLCSTTGTATITQPAAALSATATPKAVSCFGGSNGAITLSVSGGTSPYSYSWGGGDTTQNRANLSAGGTYYVTVTDANLCSTTGTATITQPAAAVNAIATPTAVSCFSGSNGAISLSVTGGTSPYSYNWGGGITMQNRTNLAAGTYNVTLTDANLCSTTGTATITQPAAALNAIATPTAVSCFSGSNGAITLGVTGGTSPYTYNWGGGITTQNRTNLSAGTYDVTVTDAKLCSITGTATITQPAAGLNAVATPTAVSCFGGNNGAITLSVTGGTSPYSFNWGGGITTQNRINLSAGTYGVTVMDANLCSTTGTATVTQPVAALSVTATPTPVSCFGGNNGAINISVTGGTSPYTYNWGGGITTPNRSNLTVATYNVTVTDANLCNISATTIISQPAAALHTILIPTQVSCYGNNTGAINLNVTGGTTPYAFNWADGVSTQNRSNLVAGTYNVTVTDSNFCSVTGTITITQPAAALSSAGNPITNVSCFGGNNGAISLSVSGGTAPYTYNWNDGFTAQNRTNLAVGTYNVTVTDADLCSAANTITITQPAAPLSVTGNAITNVHCFGGNDGIINISASGGTAPYTFNWGGGVTVQNRIGLAAGTYSVTVTDANLCTATNTSTIAITQPGAALNATPSSTQVSCFGNNTGVINLNVTGGTTPYAFKWADGVSTQNRSNLVAGTYNVTVTDSNLCFVTGTIAITQPTAALSSAGNPITNVSCFGGNNAAISLSVSGGTTPYAFNWNGGITTQNRTNLIAGTYNVTVTDANLCSAANTITITQPAAPLSATGNPLTNVPCFGGNNGAINISVTGGTAPYTFNWGGGITLQDRTGLIAGTYSVTVTDANLCTATNTSSITQPAAALNATPSPTRVSCFGGSNGAIGLSISGGTSPYSFNWGGGITTQNRTNLSAGTYDVTVTDANLCSTTGTATITQPVAALSATATLTTVSCFGGNNGAITLNVSGGTSPYSYNWSGGVTAQNRTNLSAGTYDVTVTDANLCTTTGTVTVIQPIAALSAVATPTPVSCFGDSNGAISLSVSGGTSPYAFKWDGVVTTQNRKNLLAATYHVTVTDANLCTTTGAATITQPAALGVGAAPSPLSCFGGSNGAISLSVSGGTSAYSYNWGGGITTQNRTNLTAGTYDVTVTDANLCSTTGTATITQPVAALSVTVTPTAVNCFGGNNGAISLSVSGGTAAYSYSWGGGDTAQNRTNLSAGGTYYVTVTDANLCSTTGTATITQPAAALSVTTTPTAVSCFGGGNGAITLSVSGGTLAYSYNWGGGITTQNRTNLAAGTYDVTVTDANLCTTIGTATITQPAAVLSAIATPTPVSCFGGNNGTISLSISGGTSPYSFNWGGGIITQNRTNLSAGTYQLTITDANQCSIINSAIIAQSTSVAVTAATTGVNCFGGNNGAINLTVSGGTSPYSFIWAEGITVQNRTNLSAGIYNVTVTDLNLCSATNQSNVSQPPGALNVTTKATAVSCFGGSNGAISLNVSGGVPPYSFDWKGGTTTQNRTDLSSGTYYLTVTDANACSLSTSANIAQPASALNVAATASEVSCYNENNGSISLNITGGTSPYTFNWGGGITVQNRTNLSIGTYQVTVTDTNSCSAVASETITQPASGLNISTAEASVNCFGEDNGAINLSVSGGTAPYSFNWGGGIITQSRTSLSAGTYKVTVTDANLCSAIVSAIVSQPAALNVVTAVASIKCFGENNGAITLNVTGGTSPYSFNWGGGVTTQNRSNLSAGIYEVTVTDGNSCSLSSPANIAQPASALNVAATASEVSCYNENNGSISLNITGGTSPYTFNWGGGITTKNRTNLSASTYQVTVTDANSCSAVASETITQPASGLNISTAEAPVNCFGGNNGAVTLNVTGGTVPYSFNWGGGIATQNRTSLSAGTYKVTITDANLCSVTASAIIQQPTALDVVTSVASIKCFGENNGAVTLNVTGGTSPYSFNWGGSVTAQNRSNLSAGTYQVTVTDANSCSLSASANIAQPASALNVATTASEVSCYNENNGSISLNITGGTSPYTFNWGGGITTKNRTNLSVGTYKVTITDANSCSAVASETITQPASGLNISTAQAPVNCFGGDNGAINLSVSGGTVPYSFNWGVGITTQNRTSLSAGNYKVTITDANLCSAIASAIIQQPPALDVVTSIASIKCFGGNDGAATLNVSGGTSPYFFNWGGAVTIQNRTGLSAGNYHLTVTDANGCSTTLPVSITQPASALNVNAITTGISCFGKNDGKVTANIAGGTSPFKLHWNNGATAGSIDDLAPGDYSLTVTDAQGCTDTDNTNIVSTPELMLTIAGPDLACENATGTIYLSVNNNGAAPYTYKWSNGATTQNLVGVHPGTYSVTIEDTYGCAADTSITIKDLNSFGVKAWGGGTVTLGQSIALYSLSTDSAQTTYSWTPSTSLNCAQCPSTDAQPNQSTLYTVVATDSNGCTARDTVSVYVIDNHTIYIPNAFTPNGDGNNDYFQIYGNLAGIEYFNVMIFDRWGEKVFESEETNFRWDGTYKGVLQNPGVFVYVIKIVFQDGYSSPLYKGSVTLVR